MEWKVDKNRIARIVWGGGVAAAVVVVVLVCVFNSLR